MKSFITSQKIERRTVTRKASVRPLFVPSLNSGEVKKSRKKRTAEVQERTPLPEKLRIENSRVKNRRGVRFGIRTDGKNGGDKSGFFPRIPSLPSITLPISKNRLSIYTAGLFFLVLFLLFLNSSVPTSGMIREEDLFVLPREDSIDDILFDSLFDTSVLEEEEDLKIPDGSVLRSVEPRVYTVEKGDTVSEIASEYNVSIGTILSFNTISDVRKVKIGTELRIPSINGILYRVKRGDTLSGISAAHGISLNNLLDANDLQSSVIRIGQELFIPGGTLSRFELKKATGELFVYPTSGRLSSGFGIRPDPFTGVPRMHYGIDLANYEGTAIKAAYDGSVVAIGVNQGYGKYIIIKHSGGYQTLYGHLSRWIVTKGQSVVQGQKIGEMGNTGRSTGPHLHFGIYKYQKPVDPLDYLF